LGGTAALSPAVATAVGALGHAVVRLGGANRFETATLIAATLGSPGTVFLADGAGAAYADALVAGVAAANDSAAVLLTDGTSVPPATATYLAAHAGSRITLGAASTAVPGGIVIPGADVYERSANLAARFWPAGNPTVGVASGEVFADALSGGAAIAHAGGPLLLVQLDSVPSSVSAYLQGAAGTILGALVFGGSARISGAVVSALQLDVT
jgi:putative cell wall-binding protein